MSTQNDFQDSIPQYDAHIIPAESAARQDREGKDFWHTSHVEASGELSEVTEGYTVDKEGLLNNYAIEPEMYVNVPGDMRDQTAQEQAEYAHQLQELSEDEGGKLTAEHDWRHKGPGLI
ncbi:hypothetical protein DO97_00180 [Neosynechococcus sphagnicola sy1]|uniref:Uncharacterized protein n=1 Tax=Neosynechococcus sphagnicola sy1 TaxID=1497020 RepID=A0A098TNX3_9CYAN|nr:hypothetical protein [Neosynechococcus sphagnicola]KGF73994.1 hypothetical protein DO97_00180 [Neosynechococcus sphagnicola sy1]